MAGTWREIRVANHVCDVFEPSRRDDRGFVALYLHGVHLQRLPEQPAFVEPFERLGMPIVAPMTRRSWWTDRICCEFDARLTAERHLRENVLPWIAENFGVHDRGTAQPSRIGLIGTSMGGQGALRLAYKYPQLFPVVAALSPAIDYQLRFFEPDSTIPQMYSDPEAARQDTALLHVHPLNWPRHQFFCCDPTDHTWWDSSDRLRMKLSSLGIPFVADLETTGGGHGFAYYARMAQTAASFLVERLDQERRRVV